MVSRSPSLSPCFDHGRSCEYHLGQAQQGHIHRSRESDQILTGSPLPPFPRSLSSSAAIGMLVTSRSLPPFLFLRLAAIMEFSSCRAWHFGVRSFVRSFVRSNQMARWDLVARSLAVNEGGGGRRRYVARLLHPILRVYPIWPRRMTRRTHALDLAWATFAGGRFGPTIPRAPR